MLDLVYLIKVASLNKLASLLSSSFQYSYHLASAPQRRIHSRDNFPSRVYFLTFIILTAFSSTIVHADSIKQPTIAVVIDDMGNNLKNGQKLIDLPYPLTFAFLPNRKHTLNLAKQASAENKEIMLHSPMENYGGIKLGQGGLDSSMSEMQIKQTLRKSFIAIPNMIGLNNHMGSSLTEHPKYMRWVMEAVSQHPFFFLDSRTSPKSLAAKTAEEFQIPSIRRDVFLDHFQNRKFVQRQFNKLIEIARKNGTAVAIGHPHEVTVEYLAWALKRLDEKGIRIATVSAIWQIQNPGKTMKEIFSKRSNKTRRSLANKSTNFPPLAAQSTHKRASITLADNAKNAKAIQEKKHL